ncbi:MAG TPA: sulfotransferase [Oleiagrimonas sp.]|nr:sulfotransferase [Oleiagrimonas sp.]
MNSRLRGLSPESTRQLIGAAQALESGQPDAAESALAALLRAHPAHPEVLRLNAGMLDMRGRSSEAMQSMRRALSQRPGDALYHNTMATVLGNAGEYDAAVTELKQACKLEPRMALAWFNLGVMLTRCVRNDEAVEALKRAVQLAPEDAGARAMLADLLRTADRVEEATREYRRILAEHPSAGMAWWGLADLKTVPFEDGDIKRMQTAVKDTRASDDDRIASGMALARALDEAGHYEDALGALNNAHALARRRRAWNASGFSDTIAAITKAFEPFPQGAKTDALGHEAIFIVGMPRSGSTLVEQILASHHDVAGAGELHDLPAVIAEESQRRGQAFPAWVAAMQPADWERLGRRYLERTAHWRGKRPVSTDKLPNNWMYIGAIRAMLPGARIVCCHRDPVETCFSCYRQHLDGNDYTRTFDDLAAFWRDSDQTMRHWQSRAPDHVFGHDHEQLLADPEARIRALLEGCGLAFDPACLAFHETRREVRSPSATQVRQPLRRSTAHTPRYGELLDPLRHALGLS